MIVKFNLTVLILASISYMMSSRVFTVFNLFLYWSFIFQQTHLLNPSLIELGLRFYIATASWLNQVALAGDSFDEMTSFKEVEIPLPSEVGIIILLCCA